MKIPVILMILEHQDNIILIKSEDKYFLPRTILNGAITEKIQNYIKIQTNLDTLFGFEAAPFFTTYDSQKVYLTYIVEAHGKLENNLKLDYKVDRKNRSFESFNNELASFSKNQLIELIKQKQINQQDITILVRYLEEKEIINDDNFVRIGFIGRFQPIHKGHIQLLKTLSNECDFVRIGIGSCNVQNKRNPLSYNERLKMLELVLKKENIYNYEIIPVPDFGFIKEYENGQKWKTYLYNTFNYAPIVSGNPYTQSLLLNSIDIKTVLEKPLDISSTQVRKELCLNGKSNNIPYYLEEFIKKECINDLLKYKEFYTIDEKKGIVESIFDEKKKINEI